MFVNIASRGVIIEHLQVIRNRLSLFETLIRTIPKRMFYSKAWSERFAKSVSAIFKKVEVQLSAVISLVV